MPRKQHLQILEAEREREKKDAGKGTKAFVTECLLLRERESLGSTEDQKGEVDSITPSVSSSDSVNKLSFNLR